ncbi:cytochrome c maturation protein CcmE [Runella sp. MFBS21]|jgi:cytochrome c-type biogenesis protein CcmE|uniref:cytochrome c maturation protein CcmE domain-containing protein n=1 Tax=Runella TaxID=105 RepID=UPI0003FBCCBD|nr:MULTISPECIES: cytochrome c maturation protein CcmE [Runella]MDF7818762.1 cytochrome c maturation protein CcmE [Runella sp. MFBS21]
MKKIHLFGLIVIAIAIGIIVSTYGNASTYSNFTEATEMAKEGETSDIHVVGKLKKDASGQIVGMKYDPVMDANHFEFVLVDTNKVEKRVVYLSPKPQDFDKSEQVVVIGKMQGDYFACNKILMKCPSKYTNEKPDFKEATAEKI